MEGDEGDVACIKTGLDLYLLRFYVFTIRFSFLFEVFSMDKPSISNRHMFNTEIGTLNRRPLNSSTPPTIPPAAPILQSPPTHPSPCPLFL
jgi:hypothetical protein